MSNYLRKFSEISKEDVSLVGGKAASLGELTKAHFPIPPGFVITTECYQEFWTKDLPADVKDDILKAFDALQADYVAVRSSATAEDSITTSWAGQLESYLNVTKDNLIDAIRKCWESIHSEHALAYASQNNINKKDLAVGVVVQKMVKSDVSGVMFTINPVTNNSSEIMIEAGYGLGELLVQGIITPDNFLVRKDTLEFLESTIASQDMMLVFKDGKNKKIPVPENKKDKPSLTSQQVNELVKIGMMIEKHYSAPQDIEWAIEKEKIYIVQSRPITTLNTQVEPKKLFNIDDYLLALWFQGVSVFVTDIHNDLYKDLEALFIIDRGMFKQYFTKKAYERALDRGVTFYSSKNAFDEYKKDLTLHCERFKDFFEYEVKDKKHLSEKTVSTFFEYTVKLCGDYTKMNFEFTDKAFILQNTNSVIKKNLSGVAGFKDTVRNFMNMVLFEPEGYSYQFFDILAKQFKIPSSIFENLTQKEILDLFENKKPDEEKVSKRQEAFVESYNIENFLEAREAEEILQEFREKVKHTNSIRGQTASLGKAQGKVKIISVDYSDLKLLTTEIEKMQKGDILVAETTAPELMAACKKAGAIVTDMGGLMSHAAIISREFKIPCIVGTKYATQILKDGDYVEVDANEGIISKINID